MAPRPNGEVVAGRAVRVAVEDRDVDIVVWSIHNHALEPAELAALANQLHLDFTVLHNPKPRLTWVCGDWSFLAPGERAFVPVVVGAPAGAEPGVNDIRPGERVLGRVLSHFCDVGSELPTH